MKENAMGRKREINAKRRPRGRPFKPGNKAAKGHGRPPVSLEYKAAMKQLEPEALQVLGDVLRDPRHPHREKAAEYVVNRTQGKPTERREITGPGGEAIGKQFPELLAALDKLAGGE